MDCKSASAAERVCDCGEGVQCPNERNPIFFMPTQPIPISASPEVQDPLRLMKFLREWAHAPPFESSATRPAALLRWITDYNATVRTPRQQIATEIAALIAS